jgi:hypothetical protein
VPDSDALTRGGIGEALIGRDECGRRVAHECFVKAMLNRHELQRVRQVELMTFGHRFDGPVSVWIDEIDVVSE